MSVSAYKRTMREAETPRAIERQIFSRITAALAVYAATYDTAEDRETRLSIMSGGLQVALAENTRLWSVLKADLARPENALPEALRAQLISLALFVERQTKGVLRGEATVTGLVNINRSIIEGLAGNAPEGVAA